MTKFARWLTAALFAGVLAAAFPAPVGAQGVGPSAAPTTHIQVSALPTVGVDNFDADKAVNAYLAKIGGKERARSDAYFEGGYVLSAVDLIYTLAIAGLLLWFRISAKMRDIATGITRSRFWQAPIYVVQYVVVTTLAGLPLTFYEGFVREHAYGLSNQSFAAWGGDFSKSFVVSLIVFVILLTIIYAIGRAAKGRWWVWGAGVTIVFLAVQIAISPVFIEPMFNKYTPMTDGPMKSAVLSVARANAVPADNVYVFDASRQSKRISANVSGFMGTTRIALNDNLLKDCTPAEVLAVLGHEIGHYVMNHIGNMLILFGLLALVVFGLVDWTFRKLVGVFGGNWDVRTISDPAGLPLIVALFSFFLFLATPITNTIIRTNEIQADYYGLNAVRQPDAFANIALKLSTYRKLDPTPLEEFWFFDHPSGRSRIAEAMHWKAEHLNDPDILAGPISPQ